MLLSVRAVSTDEFCCCVDSNDSQGVLALQFENGGRLPSNPVQEIHDHVNHDLHSQHRDGPHRHAEGPQRHLKAFATCPLLQELVDSIGERLSEFLQFLMLTWRCVDLHAQIKNPSVLIFLALQPEPLLEPSRFFSPALQ